MSEAPSIDSYLALLGAPRESSGIPAVSLILRNYMAAARLHLEQLHRSGASGQQVNEAGRINLFKGRLAAAEDFADGSRGGIILEVLQPFGEPNRGIGLELWVQGEVLQ